MIIALRGLVNCLDVGCRKTDRFREMNLLLRYTVVECLHRTQSFRLEGYTLAVPSSPRLIAVIPGDFSCRVLSGRFPAMQRPRTHRMHGSGMQKRMAARICMQLWCMKLCFITQKQRQIDDFQKGTGQILKVINLALFDRLRVSRCRILTSYRRHLAPSSSTGLMF